MRIMMILMHFLIACVRMKLLRIVLWILKLVQMMDIHCLMMLFGFLLEWYYSLFRMVDPCSTSAIAICVRYSSWILHSKRTDLIPLKSGRIWITWWSSVLLPCLESCIDGDDVYEATCSLYNVLALLVPSVQKRRMLVDEFNKYYKTVLKNEISSDWTFPSYDDIERTIAKHSCIVRMIRKIPLCIRCNQYVLSD